MKEGMKMPGFTAEASLHKPIRHYNLGVNQGVDGHVVIPQVDWCYHYYKPEKYGGSNSQCYYACIQDSHCSQSDCEIECDYEKNPPKVHPIW